MRRIQESIKYAWIRLRCCCGSPSLHPVRRRLGKYIFWGRHVVDDQLSSQLEVSLLTPLGCPRLVNHNHSNLTMFWLVQVVGKLVALEHPPYPCTCTLIRAVSANHESDVYITTEDECLTHTTHYPLGMHVGELKFSAGTTLPVHPNFHRLACHFRLSLG